MSELPVGEVVEFTEPVVRPILQQYSGRFITLVPVQPEQHVDDLYAASHGDAQREAIWTYMPKAGPFAGREAMLDWLRLCVQHPDFIFFTVIDQNSGRPIGMLSYASIVPDMQRLEIAYVWYHPHYQRTQVNTEAVYLLLCEAFDQLHYRRVEWKCDALNQPSRQAALRLGFQYEGLFRKHMIVHGRNRDTAWFAMLDEEWGRIKANMQRWLYDNDGSLSLRTLNQVDQAEILNI